MRFPARTAGIFLAVFLVLAPGVFSQEDGALALFDEAKAALNVKDWVQAQKLCETFQTRYPDHPQAPAAAFLRATALYQQGQAQAAYDAFQKMGRQWPDSPYQRRLPFWKGVAALGCGQLENAEKALRDQEKYPQEKPFYPRSLFYLGVVLSKKGQDPGEAWDRYLSLGTEYELRAQAALDWAARWEKDPEKALAVLQRVEPAPGAAGYSLVRSQLEILIKLQKSGPAVELAVRAQRLFPDQRSELLAFQAEAQRQAGDKAGLGKTLADAASWAKTPEWKQKIAVNQALNARDRGDLQAALTFWEKASAGPDPALALQAARERAWGLKDQPEAAASFLMTWAASRPGSENTESAIRMGIDLASDGSAGATLQLLLVRFALKSYPGSPDRPFYLHREGVLLLQGGDTDTSLADFQRVVKDFPQYKDLPEVRYQMGLVYMKRAEPIRAEGYFFGLCEELKTGELYQRALLARGFCFFDAGKTDLARGSLQRLLRESPDSPWAGSAWFALGKTEAQDRNFGPAAEAFAQAAEKMTGPTDREKALTARAEALVSQQDWKAAAEAFALLVRQFPESRQKATAVLRQGRCLALQGDWAAAVDLWGQNIPSVGPGEKAVRLALGEAVSEGDLHLGKEVEAWKNLETTVSGLDPEAGGGAWFRFAQTAAGLAKDSLASRAYQAIVERYPTSSWVESALPRSAVSLMTAGNPEGALAGYEKYFQRFGKSPSSASVARSAGLSLTTHPEVLQQLVAKASRWDLAPEVSAEFRLTALRSQIDADSSHALADLQDLSRTAPWASQRSEAFLIAGEWALRQNRLDDAAGYLTAAADLGDDLSKFRGKFALASLEEKKGNLENAARRWETAERTAGLAVPGDFKKKALQEALRIWEKRGGEDDRKRVQARLKELYPDAEKP